MSRPSVLNTAFADRFLLIAILLVALCVAADRWKSSAGPLRWRETPLEFIAPERGFGYATQLGWNRKSGAPPPEVAALYEDGAPLGPEVESADKVSDLGGGIYCASRGTLHFSTTDGSDPSSNGKKYTARVGSHGITPVRLAFLFASRALLVLAVLFAGVARLSARRRLPGGSTVTLAPLRVAALFAIAGAGAFLAGAALRPVMPLTSRDDPEIKAEMLRSGASGGEPFTALFIGSSRVFREIDPARFDEVLAGRGYPSRAFNFGVEGTRALALPALLRTALSADSDHALKWVFIAVEPVGWRISDRNLTSNRVASWHDWRTMTRITRHFLAGKGMSPARKLGRVKRRLIPFFRRTFNYGTGSAAVKMLHDAPGREEDPPFRTAGRGDGFLSLDEELPLLEGRELKRLEMRRDVFLAGADRFDERVHREEEDIDASGQGDPVMNDLLGELQSLVRAHGAEAVFFVGPELRPRHDMVEAAAAGVVDHFLDFHDPRLYPEIHTASVHFDTNHLNGEGAALYTTLFAERFVDLLDAGDVAP